MANSTKTHDLMNGPTADALQVDTNFDEIHSFLNSHVLHTDGSRPMSNPLQLDDGSPAASQAYVDAATVGVASSAGTLVLLSGSFTIPAGGVLTNEILNFGTTFINPPALFFQVYDAQNVTISVEFVERDRVWFTPRRTETSPNALSGNFAVLAIGGVA